MFQIDLKSRKALYEQIVDNFKQLIIADVLKPTEKVPSVRDLAKSLTINPNTIQKAYRELENQGYIYTVSGLGSFISAPPEIKSDEKKINELKNLIRESVQELLYLKCTEEEIKSLFEESNITFKGGQGR